MIALIGIFIFLFFISCSFVCENYCTDFVDLDVAKKIKNIIKEQINE